MSDNPEIKTLREKVIMLNAELNKFRAQDVESVVKTGTPMRAAKRRAEEARERVDKVINEK